MGWLSNAKWLFHLRRQAESPESSPVSSQPPTRRSRHLVFRFKLKTRVSYFSAMAKKKGRVPRMVPVDVVETNGGSGEILFPRFKSRSTFWAYETAFSLKEKKRSVHRKRIQLEEEVKELRKWLDLEKKVNQVLKRAVLEPNTGSDFQVPSFLPIKTRELLIEVVMVQCEISRLESVVSDIKKETQELRSNNRKQSSRTEIPHKPSLFCLMRIESQMEEREQKAWIETEPPVLTHQVSECQCDNWGIASNGGTPLKKVQTSKAPGVQIMEDEISFDRSPSPVPTPTSLASKKLDQCQKDATSTVEEADLFISRSNEKCRKDLQPNKLSEEIMKCLISIFSRLTRISGNVENDKSKSGLMSMTSSSLSSGYTIGHVNDSSLSEPNVLKQQDPYDIFQIKGSHVRDIKNYKNLAICTSDSLDMKAIVTCVPLLRKLRILRGRLRDVNLKFLTHKELLAFWINMHNTAIMQVILENGLPSNPEELLALRKKAVLNIGGIKLGALATEHFFILKQPSDLKDVRMQVSWEGKKDDNGEDLATPMYRLVHSEPNIIFGLCNGTKSSPAVRIYTAENIHMELEEAKLEYLQASIAVTATEKIMIPKMLLWNMNNFAKDLDSLVLWICHQLPKSEPLRRSMMVCLKGSNRKDVAKLVEIIPYDFGFQLLLSF